jgi:type VII secretion integral membrane protein EccD
VRTGSWVAGFAVALVLIAAGAMASRAYGDSTVGAVLAAYGIPFAFAGGLLLGGGPWHPESILVGCAATLLASVFAAVGVAHGLRLFAGGAAAGVLGALGALVGMLSTPAGAAAVLLALLVTGIAGVPLLAIRLGKLPMPVMTLPGDLTTSGRGLAEIEARPERSKVFAAVARTDELLTGMLLGVAICAAAGSYVLARSDDVSGWILIGVASAALLLRARIFVTVRQRLPMLLAGLAGLAMLGVVAVQPGGAVAGVVAAVLLTAVALMTALTGTRYAAGPPSPYLGRAADLLDALCVVSVVPLAVAVLGLYGLARGIGG